MALITKKGVKKYKRVGFKVPPQLAEKMEELTKLAAEQNMIVDWNDPVIEALNKAISTVEHEVKTAQNSAQNAE